MARLVVDLDQRRLVLRRKLDAHGGGRGRDRTRAQSASHQNPDYAHFALLIRKHSVPLIKVLEGLFVPLLSRH